MRHDKVLNAFTEIKRAFPDVQLSSSYKYILIPRFPLPSKFNKAYTPLLIRINSDYQAPDAYVDHELRIYGHRSHHLDEALTEEGILERGWVKLCVQVNWYPNLSLIDFVLMVMKYVKNLEGNVDEEDEDF